MVLVLAFGNPLLDFVVKLTNKNIIQKFKLQEDGHKEVSQEEMLAIFKEVKNSKYDWSNVPGGSALNTMRILQWLYDHERSTVVFGAVGTDPNSILLKNMVEEYRVKTKFAFIDDQTTGWVLSLVHKITRSLIANIGAAKQYSKLHFDTQENKLLISESNLIYMEGFFLTKRSEISRYIVDLCTSNKKTFAFNLNAEYLINDCTDDVIHCVQYSNILFGNGKEFTTLAKVMHSSKDELLKTLVANKSDKLLVVTNGSKAVHVHTQHDIVKYEVPPLKPDEIVDTTGCGDAFAAGFLYGHIQEHPPLRCIKWGVWMAHQVIKQIGCAPPGRLLPTEIYKIE